jgi:SGNH hydrolase-like domain, acetyltransferase AlgX
MAYGLFWLAFIEFSLQAFYRVTTGSFLFSRAAQPIYAEEPFGGWVAKPNLSYRHGTPEFTVDVFTNSRGFRTSRARAEYAQGRNPSRYRVLLLGPSFAFGWGVDYEQSFAAELQRTLTAAGFAGSRTVEIVNCGVPGLTPANGLNWFKHVGRDYAPDLVIQFVYQSMQVHSTAARRYVWNGYLLTDEPTLPRLMIRYARSSAIEFYAWTVAMTLRSRLWPTAQGSIHGTGRETTAVGAFDLARADVADSLAFYEDLRSTAQAAGARLLVMYFPLAYAVHPQDIDRWRHLGLLDVPQQVAFDWAFCSHLNLLGIACLNLTQKLIDHAERSGKRLYYWLDIHWTPEGNVAAARAAADWLLVRPQWSKPL